MQKYLKMGQGRRVVLFWALALGLLGLSADVRAQEEPLFQDTFNMVLRDLRPRGVNDYFIPLIPGYELLLEGDDEGEAVRLLITVLPRTKIVSRVLCAVVREMEWADDELVEISWNYFAISQTHKGIFYHGEDVDIYEDGEVVSHDGAWLAGIGGAKAGLIMPGYPLLGSRYYQEIAPEVALDRAEHISVTGVVDTPAGTFENCLFIVETTPLEPGSESFKAYARGIGLVQDGILKLVDYGFHVKADDEEEEEEDEDEDEDEPNESRRAGNPMSGSHRR